MSLRCSGFVSAASQLAIAISNAERALFAGFTSIREAGGYGIYLSKAINEGSIEGPNIYSPGSILSQTGGHADLHSLPIDCLTHSEGFPLQLCDGVPEVLKAVRKQLRLGARVIKICASGGVLSEVDHPIHQQFSDEEIKTNLKKTNNR